jgi:Zn2+/Cd2+-exporting ATPase
MSMTSDPEIRPEDHVGDDVAQFTCSVPDMDCPSCAEHIERSLRAQQGVLDVGLSVVGQHALVRYDARQVSPQELARAIEAAGYTVSTGGVAPRLRFWRQRLVQVTLASGVLYAAGLLLLMLRGAAPGQPLWLQWPDPAELLLISAGLVGGVNFLPRGLGAVRRLSLDMDFLMSAAIVGAVVIGEFFEAASLAFLYSVAELLEDFSVARARSSLRALTGLAPDTATVRRDGGEAVVPAAAVVPADIVIVRPGDRVPVDGVVEVGRSSVDQATLTGESEPVLKEPGDEAYGGTLSLDGYLEVRATRVAGDSALSRIIKMVESAEERRAPSELFVRRFARVYTPVIALLALGVMVVPSLAFGLDFGTWFARGLALLVIACPCALVISTPVAVVSAIASAARRGVVIKGGIFLEELGRIRVVAIDKTGTLTRGAPEVVEVTPLDGLERQALLVLAAALEARSEHPTGRAIVRAAGAAELPEVTEFQAFAGKGVQARLNGELYTVGRPELFPTVEMKDVEQVAAGRSAVVVGTEDRALGVVSIADAVRPEARQAVAQLQSQGIHVVMLTGDAEAPAGRVAEQLGIGEWHAQLLPAEKLALVEQLQAQHGPVAMVGDGVNDAPALACARVGVAMGAIGSDLALETADVALMSDDLRGLPYLIDLSRGASRVIRQNIWASLIIKLSLAAGVFPGIVNLATAIIVGDMGTALGVTANSLRLARVRAQRPGADEPQQAVEAPGQAPDAAP